MTKPVSEETKIRIVDTLLTLYMPTAINLKKALPDVTSDTIYRGLKNLQNEGRVEKIGTKYAEYKVIRRLAE